MLGAGGFLGAAAMAKANKEIKEKEIMSESYTEEELRMKPEDCKLSDKTKNSIYELAVFLQPVYEKFYAEKEKNKDLTFNQFCIDNDI